MTSLQALKNPAGYHILSYGTLIGSTLFQSFIGGVIAYRTLPRAQFASLQKRTFPVYFTLQTVFPALMALSYPSGPISLYRWRAVGDKLAAALTATMFVSGLLNLLWIGPQTTEVMRQRKHQEYRDEQYEKQYEAYRKSEKKSSRSERKEKKSGSSRGGSEAGGSAEPALPTSEKMQALNRKFGILHGVSTAVNMVGLASMCWYGVLLGQGLKWAAPAAQTVASRWR